MAGHSRGGDPPGRRGGDPPGRGALAAQGFERLRASLIVVAGGAAPGEEHAVDQPRWLVGRGPGVDTAIADPDMAPRHAALEFQRGAFTLTDLSGGGATAVNGSPVERCEVRHGDRIAMGGHVFQLLIDPSGPEA